LVLIFGRYERNVNFATKQLVDLTNTVVIPASIDPFFFKISWPEEEEKRGFEWLEIEGLTYERLSIKKLKLKVSGEENENDEHVARKAGAISRLLWRIVDGIEHEEEDE
jgi:hypothetical protein